MFMVTLIRGCTLNCTTCMGGCRSFERNFNRPGPAFCTPEKLAAEITRIDDYLRGMIFVVGDVQLPGKHFPEKLFAAMRKDRPRNELCFEFFTPPPKELIRLMGRSLDRFDAQISPDSHDPEVRRAQGRTYSNKALEVSLGDLLEAGADRVDVFFMIGLPKQDHKSVMDTVRYSEALMNRMAAGERLLAFVSPLAPFLDPGSEAFNEPARHGYKILAHTLEEHRALLLNPSWKHVLNYETRWLSRDDIVRATYNAGEALNDAKERLGILSPEKAGVVRERVTFAREAISRIDVAMTSPEPERALAALKHDLRELSDSTVCDKRELDWDRKSWIWSMPRALIALLAGK
jgi:B12-binding domain/radical SAM domain protein